MALLKEFKSINPLPLLSIKAKIPSFAGTDS
jgi:hypothetical protein